MQQNQQDGEPVGTTFEEASLEVDRIRLALRNSYIVPFSYDPGLRRRLIDAMTVIAYCEPVAVAAQLRRVLQVLAEAPEGYAENGCINDTLADAFLAVFAAFDERVVPPGGRAAPSANLQ
ncbi:hypothetical protein [uncultured Jannaschia sp.]|uniref:hypothetical protein n=1 Tax=uncultured Jannaschia sp. TaxID=293347 RepID=UPI0026068BF7|nr:hypothetical protein [uncultured Jannaschia sp.]